MLALLVNCPTFLKHQARIRLERTLDAALRSRDGLAVQLVAQGSTVHSQHEKIRLQESALQRCGAGGV